MQHPNPPDHARHDAALIAGHAAGDLNDIERARADDLLAECGACGELRRDLIAISAATRSVPAPTTLHRDLRLPPEQAERLRRGSWLRGILRPFGAAGSPIRPIATAFTSLGVVGLVVGITLSSGAQLAGGAAPGPNLERGTVPQAAASAAPVARASDAAAQGGYEAQVVRASDGKLYQVLMASDGTYYLATTPASAVVDAHRSRAPRSVQPGETDVAFGAANQGGRPVGLGPSGDTDASLDRLTAPPNPLIAGSLALLGIGLLLFGLRLASTRVR
jgi:hypothetical protein